MAELVNPLKDEEVKVKESGIPLNLNKAARHPDCTVGMIVAVEILNQYHAKNVSAKAPKDRTPEEEAALAGLVQAAHVIIELGALTSEGATARLNALARQMHFAKMGEEAGNPDDAA